MISSDSKDDEKASSVCSVSQMASPTQSGSSNFLSSNSDELASSHDSSPRTGLCVTVQNLPVLFKRTKSDTSSSTPSLNTSSSGGSLLISPQKGDSTLHSTSSEEDARKHPARFECLQLSGESVASSRQHVINIDLSPTSPTKSESFLAVPFAQPAKKSHGESVKVKSRAGPVGLPKWVREEQHSPFSSSEEMCSSSIPWSRAESPLDSPSKLQGIVADSQQSLPGDQAAKSKTSIEFATSTQNAGMFSGLSGRPSMGNESQVFPPLKTKPPKVQLSAKQPDVPSEATTSRSPSGDVPTGTHFQMWPAEFQPDNIKETPPSSTCGQALDRDDDKDSLGECSQDLFELTSSVGECSEMFELSVPQQNEASSRTISLKRKGSETKKTSLSKKTKRATPVAESQIGQSSDAAVDNVLNIIDIATRELPLDEEVVEFYTIIRKGAASRRIQHRGDVGAYYIRVDEELNAIEADVEKLARHTSPSRDSLKELTSCSTVSKSQTVESTDKDTVTGEDSQNTEHGSTATFESGTKVFAEWEDGFYYPGRVTQMIDPGRSPGRLCEIHFCDDKLRTLSTSRVVAIKVLKQGQRVLYYDEQSKVHLVGIVNVCSSQASEGEMYEVQTEDNDVISVPRSSIILSRHHIMDMETIQENIDNTVIFKKEIIVLPERRQSSRVTQKKVLPVHAQPNFPEDTSLFSGMFFLVTTANASSSDSSLDSSEPDTSDLPPKPMNLTSLKLQIQHCGGTILEKYSADQLLKYEKVYCLSNGHKTTPKYMISLACNIPCVDANWIVNSCDLNKLLDFTKYILPRGRDVLTHELVEVGLNQAPFLNKLIYIHDDKNRVNYWTNVLSCTGCTIMKSFPKPDPTETYRCDVFVVGRKAVPPLIIRQLKRQNIPRANVKWLVQCLVIGKWFDADSNDVFLYKPLKVRRSERKKGKIEG